MPSLLLSSFLRYWKKNHTKGKYLESIFSNKSNGPLLIPMNYLIEENTLVKDGKKRNVIIGKHFKVCYFTLNFVIFFKPLLEMNESIEKESCDFALLFFPSSLRGFSQWSQYWPIISGLLSQVIFFLSEEIDNIINEWWLPFRWEHFTIHTRCINSAESACNISYLKMLSVGFPFYIID